MHILVRRSDAQPERTSARTAEKRSPHHPPAAAAKPPVLPRLPPPKRAGHLVLLLRPPPPPPPPRSWRGSLAHTIAFAFVCESTTVALFARTRAAEHASSLLPLRRNSLIVFVVVLLLPSTGIGLAWSGDPSRLGAIHWNWRIGLH
ncbi:hypothetical protein VPH35_072688 [Triticum aestivum]